MRQIYVDLTTDNARLPAGNFVGYIGEHNATELLISIPQSMVDASDYQVLILQSGPMVFKSKHIGEDKSEPTYRDGNTIHTKLSKSLTSVSPLSLQVECYKENDAGEAVLIGKTSQVPNLVLKPSPQGYPAFNYDGSYEDIEAAIELAHKHGNIDILNAFSKNENGELVFEGKLIESLKVYDNPDEFPAEDTEGALAFALNPSPAAAPERIELQTEYPAAVVKKNLPADFYFIKDYCNENEIDTDEETCITRYHKDYTIRGAYGLDLYSSIACVDGVCSVFYISVPIINELKMRYRPLECMDLENSLMYFYNPGEPFDFDSVGGQERGGVVPHGWSLAIQRRGDFEIKGTTYLNYDYNHVFEFQPIEGTDNPAGIIANALFEPYRQDNDLQELELINRFFELYNEGKEAGIYIMNKGSWLDITGALNKQNHIIDSFIELPLDAAEGSTAFILTNAQYYNPDGSSNINLQNTNRSVWFNPAPGGLTRAVDFDYKAAYGTGGYSSFTPEGTAYQISTNKEHDYLLLSLLDWDTKEMVNYVFSWKDQEIALDNLENTISVQLGWNKLLVNDDFIVVVEPITRNSDIPHLEMPDYNRYIKGVSLSVDGFPEAVSLCSDLVSYYSFFEEDNLRGLWVKTKGTWIPTFIDD